MLLKIDAYIFGVEYKYKNIFFKPRLERDERGRENASYLGGDDIAYGAAKTSASSPYRGKVAMRDYFMGACFSRICACLIPFGGHFMKLAPAALKGAFLNDLLWKPVLTNAAFGVFLSAINWANLFLPALQGKYIDNKGSGYVALILAFAQLAGHALFCYAVGAHMYWIAVIGRVIFGQVKEERPSSREL